MFKKEKIISFKKYKETHSIISWKDIYIYISASFESVSQPP